MGKAFQFIPYNIARSQPLHTASPAIAALASGPEPYPGTYYAFFRSLSKSQNKYKKNNIISKRIHKAWAMAKSGEQNLYSFIHSTGFCVHHKAAIVSSLFS